MASYAIIISIVASGIVISTILIIIIVFYRKWIANSVVMQDDETLGLINESSEYKVNKLISGLKPEKPVLPASISRSGDAIGNEEIVHADARQVGHGCVNILGAGNQSSYFGVVLRLEKNKSSCDSHTVHIEKVLQVRSPDNDDYLHMRHIVVILGFVFLDGSIKRFKTEMAPISSPNHSTNHIHSIELNQHFNLFNSTSRQTQISLDNLSDQLEVQIILLDKYARRKLKVDCLVCWETSETDGKTVVMTTNERRMCVVVPEMINIDSDDDDDDDDECKNEDGDEDFNFDDNGHTQSDQCTKDNRKCGRVMGYVTTTSWLENQDLNGDNENVVMSTKINKIEPQQTSCHYHRRWENTGNNITLFWLGNDRVVAPSIANSGLRWRVPLQELQSYVWRQNLECKSGRDRYYSESESALIPTMFWNVLSQLLSESGYLVIIHSVYKVPFSLCTPALNQE